MREMENIPRDNNKNSNILVDDDEVEKNKNIENNTSHNDIIPQDAVLNIHLKENQYEQTNYLSQMFHKNFSYNIIILLSLIFLIMIEFIYRRPLFTYSLTYEQNLQNSLTKNAFEFYKLISFLGNGFLIGLGLFFVLCYYSLLKTISLCIGTIFIVYLHDVMKLLYGDPRPFWLNSILFQGSCETSYGNPSGHSLTSFFFLLSLSYYICMLDNFKNNKTYKIIVYCIGIFLSGLIAFSRLALGVHSIDQVLYGSGIGIWLFFIFAYVFKVYDMPLSYYLRFYKEKKYSNFIMIFLTLLFILPIVLYYLIDVDSDFKKYEMVMKKKCPGKAIHKFYSHNCMAQSLVILLICGIYFGQYIFWYLIYKNNNSRNDNSYIVSLEESINHWNYNYKEILSSIGNIIKVAGLILIILLPGALYFIIPNDSSLKNIFIFKIGLPLFLIGFLSFGPCLYSLMHILKEKRRNFV